MIISIRQVNYIQRQVRYRIWLSECVTERNANVRGGDSETRKKSLAAFSHKRLSHSLISNETVKSDKHILMQNIIMII